MRERHGFDADEDLVRAVERGDLPVAIASWWGYDEEDATEALQGAIDSRASLVIVPDMGTSWEVEPIDLGQDDQTIWFEEGTVVRAKEGSFLGRGDCLFEINSQENVYLVGYGARLEMRKADYQEAPYRRSAWRMGVSVNGSRNIKILGLHIRESGGDGIYLGSDGDNRLNENVVIRHVVCEANFRQGMSVITARNLLVEHSEFNRTEGSSPQSGICLEPNNADEQLTDIVIRHCRFIDNTALGMHTFLSNLDKDSEPVSVRWENNYVRGSNAGIHVNRLQPDGPEGKIVYKDNLVEGSNRTGIWIREKAHDRARVIFEGNTLVNTSQHEEPRRRAPITLHGRRGADTPRQGGIEFRDTVVIESSPLDRPVMRVLHSYELDDYRDVTGQIYLSAPAADEGGVYGGVYGETPLRSQADLADTFDVRIIPGEY